MDTIGWVMAHAGYFIVLAVVAIVGLGVGYYTSAKDAAEELSKEYDRGYEDGWNDAKSRASGPQRGR